MTLSQVTWGSTKGSEPFVPEVKASDKELKKSLKSKIILPHCVRDVASQCGRIGHTRVEEDDSSSRRLLRTKSKTKITTKNLRACEECVLKAQAKLLENGCAQEVYGETWWRTLCLLDA